MNLNEKELKSFLYVAEFIEVFSSLLSFDFFLLSPCTTELWLVYHWWYAYHSLRNPDLAGYLQFMAFRDGLNFCFVTVHAVLSCLHWKILSISGKSTRHQYSACNNSINAYYLVFIAGTSTVKTATIIVSFSYNTSSLLTHLVLAFMKQITL
jgi:hypothetical protein